MSVSNISVRHRWISAIPNGWGEQNISASICLGKNSKLLLSQFSFYGMHRVGHCPQPLFSDQFTGIDTNSIGAVLYSSKCIFQVDDKFLLPCCQLAEIFALQGVCTVFQQFGGRSRVVRTTIVSLAKGLL